MASDDETPGKLFCPENSRAGARPKLTDFEERMITHRLIHAGNCGFAVDRNKLRRLMNQIASDGVRFRYRNHFPSLPTICRFRACSRDLTFRNSESKDFSKLIPESYAHLRSLKDVLMSVERAHSRILNSRLIS